MPMHYIMLLFSVLLLNSCQSVDKSQQKISLSWQDQKLQTPLLQQDLQRWVKYLASEEMQGRMTGSKEEKIYLDTIAKTFLNWGYSPYGKSKSYIQPFDFVSGVKWKQNHSIVKLTINSKVHTLEPNKDWTPLNFSSDSSDIEFKNLVFAGYGLSVPSLDKIKAYNSYSNLDVKDKWVVVFRFIPESLNAEARNHFNLSASLPQKAILAKNSGAKGLIVVSGPNSNVQKDVIAFSAQQSVSSIDIPVISISDSIADRYLFSNKLKQIQSHLDKTLESHYDLSFSKVKFLANFKLQTINAKGNNLVAYLPLPGAEKTLVLGAHIDHLGLGQTGTSLSTANDLLVTKVHYGADDNASGVAALLEMAHYFSKPENQKDLKTNLLFTLWSGEELGLLGSKSFLNSHKKNNFIAYINLDMVGRYQNKLVIQGAGSSANWIHFLKHSKKSENLNYSILQDPFLPTDSLSFQLKKIPSISFFTGSHKDYHTVRDTVDKLNFPMLLNVTDFALNVAKMVSANPDHLPFNDQLKNTQPMRKSQRHFRTYLGTIPDYTSHSKSGLAISGVKPNSPAFRSGLKEGDVITKVGNVSIKSIHDYVYVLQNLKPEHEISIEILRNQQAKILKITPISKQ